MRAGFGDSGDLAESAFAETPQDNLRYGWYRLSLVFLLINAGVLSLVRFRILVTQRIEGECVTAATSATARSSSNTSHRRVDFRDGRSKSCDGVRCARRLRR